MRINVKVILLILLLLGASFIAYDELIAHANEDVKDVIARVADDYRKTTWFNDACYVDWAEVSLGWLMYGIALNEWGHKPGTVGYRTNNWGSLHNTMGLKPIERFTCADGTCTRPVYHTVEDGLYEKAHLIASKEKRYKCNFSFQSQWAYIKWPNAPRTPEWVAHVQAHLDRLKKNALAFDWKTVKNGLSSSSNDQPQKLGGSNGEVVETDYKKCERIDLTNSDYVHFDTYEWEFIGKAPLPEWTVKVFKCWRK